MGFVILALPFRTQELRIGWGQGFGSTHGEFSFNWDMSMEMILIKPYTTQYRTDLGRVAEVKCFSSKMVVQKNEETPNGGRRG